MFFSFRLKKDMNIVDDMGWVNYQEILILEMEFLFHSQNFKGIVHSRMKTTTWFTHLQAIQDVQYLTEVSTPLNVK